MKLRAISALAVAVLAAVFLPMAQASASPRALDYPPTTCPGSISVSTTHPLPGATITVTGAGFQAGASVHLVLHTKTFDLGTFKAGANGSFVAHVTLPAGISGQHVIIAISGSASAQQCPGVPIQIQGAGGQSSGPGGPPGGTSFTGTDLLMILIAAAVLIGAGVAFNRSGKRRSAEHV
jgi:hypothetical protein